VSECKSLWPLLQRLNIVIGNLVMQGRQFCARGCTIKESTPDEVAFWKARKKLEVAHALGSECLVNAMEDLMADYTCGYSYIEYQKTFYPKWLMKSVTEHDTRTGTTNTYYIKDVFNRFRDLIYGWHQQAQVDLGSVTQSAVSIARDNTMNARTFVTADREDLVRLAVMAYHAGLRNAMRIGKCSECTAHLGLVDCSTDFSGWQFVKETHRS